MASRFEEALTRLAGLAEGSVVTRTEAEAVDEVFFVVRVLQTRVARARAEVATVIPVDEIAELVGDGR